MPLNLASREGTRKVPSQGGIYTSNVDVFKSFRKVSDFFEVLFSLTKLKCGQISANSIEFLPRNFTELGALLEKARDFERSVGHREDLRRVFAFQDECLHDIGEWSTDRRRQLRNQVLVVRGRESCRSGVVGVGDLRVVRNSAIDIVGYWWILYVRFLEIVRLK